VSLFTRIRSSWKALTRREQLENEMEIELGNHIEDYAADLVRRGLSRKDALRQARVELGSIAAQKDQLRASVGMRPLDELVTDVRYAFRQLRAAPGFALTVVLVLALGIGANAAMFSVIDSTILRWMPFPDASKVVSIITQDERGDSWAAYADIEQWQKQARSFTAISAYGPGSKYLKVNGNTQIVSAPEVGATLFSALDVQPVLGRAFLDEENIPGKNAVAVLSDRVWRLYFGGDANVLGAKITLDDAPYTVVGIMPPNFSFPVDDPVPQIWIPLAVTHNHHLRNFSTPPYGAIGRLRPGVAKREGRAELEAIQRQIAQLEDSTVNRGHWPKRIQLVSYRETLVKDSRPALLALQVAVAIIWLIACANVANLMLARSMARQREMAVRGALGAGRWRLVRQLLTEALVLSLGGAGVGVGLSQLALRVFDNALTAQLRVPQHLAPDPAVLGALLGLTFLSAMIFGLFPAVLASRTPLEQALRQYSTQAGHGRGRRRLQQAIVVAEIGMSLVLLISCGLLMRTVFALRRVPLGFRTDHVVNVRPKIPRYKYRGSNLQTAVYQPLLARIRALPEVQAASLTTIVPLNKGFNAMMQLAVVHGADSKTPPTRIDVRLRAAGPELKDVLGFKMYSGRFFNEQDTPDAQPVAVVNRAFARLYAPDSERVDDFSIGLGKGRSAKIVGVMDDFRQKSLSEPSVPEIDFCAPQMRPTDGLYQPTMDAHVELVVRTANDPKLFIPELRRVLLEQDPDLGGSVIVTMDQVVEDAMGSQLLAAHLLEIFGGAAVVVALAGLYGLLTYLVAQRRQEIGVRLALGAQRETIVEMILRQAGWLLVLGTILGTLLAYLAARLISAFLYGVAARDAATMVTVSLLLIITGLAAAYLPARKASRVDPLEALRQQ
jgi:predicted permease